MHLSHRSALRSLPAGWADMNWLSKAWYVALASLLLVDVVVRNASLEVPRSLVFVLWSVAFAAPFIVTVLARRHRR